jgi:hypothetical protein
MFDGLLRTLAAAGRDVAAEATGDEVSVVAGEILPAEAGPPGTAKALDAVGEPSLEQLEALEDELALDEDEDIDEDELARLLSGAADAPVADGASLGDDEAASDSAADPLAAARGAMKEPGAGEALLAKLIGGLAEDGKLDGLDLDDLGDPDDLDEPEEPDGPQTPAQLIYTALERALQQLLAAELLELTGPKHEELLEQLLAPCLAAPSLPDALQAALEVLVESEHVEEVYGDDDELLGLLREAFETVHREAVQNP